MRDSIIFTREYLEDLNAKREQAKDLCHLTITTYQLAFTTYHLRLTTYILLPKQAKYLCVEANRAGVQGNRGELFTIQVAPRPSP